jgi:hypothetical protein
MIHEALRPLFHGETDAAPSDPSSPEEGFYYAGKALAGW